MSSSTLVQNKTTSGAGQWVRVRKINDKRTFQVNITGTASVSLEASNDGVNAIPLLSAITATAGYEDDAPWNFVRANVTSVSGSVTIVMGEKE